MNFLQTVGCCEAQKQEWGEWDACSHNSHGASSFPWWSPPLGPSCLFWATIKSCPSPRQWIKQQRHHFADKGLYSQSDGFSSSHVQMWELDHKEGWAPKNWCFWNVVLERTLESPWTARRSNQSILKEINSEHSLEGLMLKLKLQYFGHLMWRADSLE